MAKPPAEVPMRPASWCLHPVHFRDNKCLPVKPKKPAKHRHIDLEETVCKAARGSLYTNDPGLVPLTKLHWKRAVSNQSADERLQDNAEMRIERSGISILLNKQIVRVIPLLLADVAYKSSDDTFTRFVVGVLPSSGAESCIWLFEVGTCTFPELQMLLACLGSKGALRRDLDDCFSISPTLLGTGGCGKVYLGKSEWDLPPVSGNSVTAGGRVALKEIAPRQIPIEELVRSEISFLTDVHGHPNVASLFGVFCSRKQHGEDQGKDRWLLALELYTGGDLFERVLKHGAMKEADGAEVMLGLLSALAHVHSLGIVHRDVKCENILIAENRAVLADFGIAASLNDAKAMEKRVGSPGYAAPEVLMGEPYAEKVDVFAAGVVLYYCLSAVLPFADSNVERILARTVRCKVRMDRTKFQGLSGGILKLTKTLLSKDPSQRPTAKRSFYALWILLSPQDRKSDIARQSFQAVPDDDDPLVDPLSSCPLPGILDAISPSSIGRRDERLSTLEEAEKLVKSEPTCPGTPNTLSVRHGPPAKVKRSLVALGPSKREEEKHRSREASLRPSKKQESSDNVTHSRGFAAEETAGGCLDTAEPPPCKGSFMASSDQPARALSSRSIRPPSVAPSRGSFRCRIRRYVAAIQGGTERVARSVGWRRQISPAAAYANAAPGPPKMDLLPAACQDKPGDACFGIVSAPPQAFKPALPAGPLRPRGPRRPQVSPSTGPSA